MNTNVRVDSSLLADAKAASSLESHKQVAEEGLKLLIRLKNQSRLKMWKGKLNWEVEGENS